MCSAASDNPHCFLVQKKKSKFVKLLPCETKIMM